MNGLKLLTLPQIKKNLTEPFLFIWAFSLFHSYWSKGNAILIIIYKEWKYCKQSYFKIFQIISIILENGIHLRCFFTKKNVMYKKIVNSFYFIFIILLLTYVIIVYFSEEVSLKINQNRANYSKNIETKILDIIFLKMILTI